MKHRKHTKFYYYMRTLVLNFCEAMYNITLAFEGTLGHDDPEVKQMRRDLLSGNIPTVADDKENLKSDGRNVASDFKVAYKDYKKQHALES